MVPPQSADRNPHESTLVSSNDFFQTSCFRLRLQHVTSGLASGFARQRHVQRHATCFEVKAALVSIREGQAAQRLPPGSDPVAACSRCIK